MDLTQEELIKKLHFKEKPGQIYLYLLESGPSTIANIAHDNKMGRTSVYLFIEQLSEQGIIKTIIRSKTKYYKAVDVEEIIRFSEE